MTTQTKTVTPRHRKTEQVGQVYNETKEMQTTDIDRNVVIVIMSTYITSSVANAL